MPRQKLAQKDMQLGNKKKKGRQGKGRSRGAKKGTTNNNGHRPGPKTGKMPGASNPNLQTHRPALQGCAGTPGRSEEEGRQNHPAIRAPQECLRDRHYHPQAAKDCKSWSMPSPRRQSNTRNMKSPKFAPCCQGSDALPPPSGQTAAPAQNKLFPCCGVSAAHSWKRPSPHQLLRPGATSCACRWRRPSQRQQAHEEVHISRPHSFAPIVGPFKKQASLLHLRA